MDRVERQFSILSLVRRAPLARGKASTTREKTLRKSMSRTLFSFLVVLCLMSYDSLYIIVGGC